MTRPLSQKKEVQICGVDTKGQLKVVFAPYSQHYTSLVTSATTWALHKRPDYAHTHNDNDNSIIAFFSSFSSYARVSFACSQTRQCQVT